jgi:hypothetical protein
LQENHFILLQVYSAQHLETGAPAAAAHFPIDKNSASFYSVCLRIFQEQFYAPELFSKEKRSCLFYGGPK